MLYTLCKILFKGTASHPSLYLAVLGCLCCSGCFLVVVLCLEVFHSCGFSHCTAQALGHVGFSSCSSRALEHRLNSCDIRACSSMACGIFPNQGLNPYLLHWQADSLPLSHQGSPVFLFTNHLTKQELLQFGSIYK